MPTLADVGALWAFADSVRLAADQLGDRVKDAMRLLREVDEIRLNGPLALAREAE